MGSASSFFRFSHAFAHGVKLWIISIHIPRFGICSLTGIVFLPAYIDELLCVYFALRKCFGALFHLLRSSCRCKCNRPFSCRKTGIAIVLVVCISYYSFFISSQKIVIFTRSIVILVVIILCCTSPTMNCSSL